MVAEFEHRIARFVLIFGARPNATTLRIAGWRTLIGRTSWLAYLLRPLQKVGRSSPQCLRYFSRWAKRRQTSSALRLHGVAYLVASSGLVWTWRADVLKNKILVSQHNPKTLPGTE